MRRRWGDSAGAAGIQSLVFHAVPLFWLLPFCAACASAAPFEIPDLSSPLKTQVVEADVPALYHWTSAESLRRLGARSDSGMLPFKTVGPSDKLAVLYPELAGKPGYFAWANPIGGIGVSLGEMYASKRDPAVIKFQLKRKLKILILETMEGELPRSPLDLRGIDLVFHSRRDRFHEFLLVNEGAVARATTDRVEIARDIARAVPVFRGNNWDDLDRSAKLFVAPDLFSHFGELSANFDSTVMPVLEEYSRAGAELPDPFRGKFGKNCEIEFRGIAEEGPSVARPAEGRGHKARERH